MRETLTIWKLNRRARRERRVFDRKRNAFKRGLDDALDSFKRGLAAGYDKGAK